MITIEELKSLVSKVGGDMSQADATALIKAADKDGNMGIDFSEFAKLWEALHGEGEVRHWFYFNMTFLSPFRLNLGHTLPSWTPTIVASSLKVLKPLIIYLRILF